MSIRILQIDAFTDRPFAGNPAAVCLLPAPRPERWMQDVASEMNLSETAFLVRRADGFDLRWFTPTVEVKLCGHATLASAHMLWETGQLEPHEDARFHTQSGLLLARRANGAIELDFPADPVRHAGPSPRLAAALNVEPVYVGRGREDWLVEVKDEAELRALRPDFGRLAGVSSRGVIVTTATPDSPYDFMSRFFAPGAGVDEDPVTGSAHCTLACYWNERTGRTQFRAYQASARGGKLEVELKGDRVLLRGQAVTVLNAELLTEA